MKKYLSLILVAIAAIIFTSPTAFARQKTDSTRYPLILNFYSIGTGTPDSQPLKEYIKTYQKKNRLPKMKATIVGGLGREGEYAILFLLKELNATQKTRFVAALSKALPTLKRKGEMGGINMTQDEAFDASWGRLKPEAITF